MYTRICIECTRVYKVILLLEDDILKCLPCRIIEFTKSEYFEIYTDFQKGHFFTKIKELYSEMDSPDYLKNLDNEEDEEDDEDDENSEDEENEALKYNFISTSGNFKNSRFKQQRLLDYFNSLSFDDQFRIAGIPDEELFFWFYIQEFNDRDHELDFPDTDINEF